jgi:simple sugar transport system permease protein
MDWVIPTILTVISASTPLLLAALGELVTEKAGVLNLGIEGMMLAGAIAGFAVAIGTGSWVLAVLAAALAGALLAFLFGLLTLTLLANQVATGLALTIFGIGISALAGVEFVGTPYAGLPRLNIPGLSDLPVLGELLFAHDFLIYLSFFMVFAVAWFLTRTKAGLVLRAVGENHEAAHSIGYNVNMTAGRGWIALALVVFATWKPGRALLGAYIFGGVTILQLHAQGIGVEIPSQVLSMLPYLATILVMVLISMDSSRIRQNAPACLGKVFHPAA